MYRTRFGAALVCALLASAQTLSADVKTDQRGLVKFEGTLGRIVNLFGGRAAREGVRTTIAVKGDRKISATDQTAQIIDLAEEKVYDLDLRRKSYKVTTFDELRRRMEEARRKAEEDAEKDADDRTDEAPETEGKEIEVDFSVKETGQRKAINGFDTSQAVMTIVFREKGKTLEESGGLVVTSDIWLTPAVAAMREIAEFDARYARALAGPVIAGASAEQMAAALAMYPMLKDGLDRMREESAKLQGTPILTSTTIESVKSAEQMAEEKERREESGRASASGGLGGLVGGLARRAAQRKEEPKQRATFMTTTSEVLNIATDVASADVAVPAGFKEGR